MLPCMRMAEATPAIRCCMPRISPPLPMPTINCVLLTKAWWLRALLVMAVVGVVLLDVYLLEAVLDRARARDSPSRSTLPKPKRARSLRSTMADQAAAVGTSAAASLLAAAQEGGAKLISLRDMARSALAIVPRGASSVEQQAAFVGDDAFAGDAFVRPALGLSTGSGNKKKHKKGSGSATLTLLDGLLPDRQQQQLEREHREWQELRQRYRSYERSRKGQPVLSLQDMEQAADTRSGAGALQSRALNHKW